MFFLFYFYFLSNSKYCSNSYSSRLYFSVFFFYCYFRIFSKYYLFYYFPVVPLIYFRSFPMLIRVFCCISIFIIIFYNLFIFSSFFSNLLSVLFTPFNTSSINISIFLYSMLFDFYNFISQTSIFHILLFLFFLLDINFLFIFALGF